MPTNLLLATPAAGTLENLLLFDSVYMWTTTSGTYHAILTECACHCSTVLPGTAWLLHNKMCTPLASLCIYQNGTLALQSTKNRTQCYVSPCTRITLNTPFLLTRTGKTLADLEQTSLAPKVVGRIVELNSDVSTNIVFSLSNPFSHRVLIRYFFSL